jgi:hypothetical protein
VAVNYIREFQLARGVPPHQAYNITMYVLAAMLLGGLICNLLIRPVREHHYMSEQQLAAERGRAHEQAGVADPASAPAASRHRILLVCAWAAISAPLAWGIWITISKSLVLFAAPLR